MLEPYVGFKIAIRSKWRRSSVKYVLKMKMKWAIKFNFKRSTMKNEEMKCKFKMSHLEEILCLTLAIHMVIIDMWRCAEEEALPWWIMGEQSTRLRQASTIKKGVPSCCGQDRHHRAQVECARLRCYPYGDHGYVKMRRRRSSPMVDYGGAIRMTSSIKHNLERRSILLRSRPSSSSSSGMRKVKVCSW